MADSESRVRLVADVGQFNSGIVSAAGSVNLYSGSVRRAVGSEKQLGSSAVRQRVEAVDSAVNKARQSQEKYTRQVRQTLEAFIRYNIVNQIFNRISRGIRDSIQDARDLQLALAEVQTIAGKSLSNTQLQSRVIGISNDFGVDAAKAANATYFALSNRVGDLSTSLKFVAKEAEFAKAGFLDLATAGNLTSGVLNAYGLSANAAAQINNKLFRAIELGRVTGPQLAKSLGTVNGPAADLGVKLDELLISVDKLTLSGVPVERSFTGIRQIIFSLLKPSDALSEALKQIGASSIEAAVAENGLLGTISKLSQTTGTLSADIAKLFPNLRAFGATGALLKVTSKDIEEFNKNLDGTVTTAAELVRATQADKFQKNITQFKNAFTTELGDPIIKTFNDIISVFGNVNETSKTFAVILRTLIPPVGALIAAFSVKTIISFGASLLTAGSAVEAVAASVVLLTATLGVAFVSLINGLDRAGKRVGQDAETLGKRIDVIRNALDKISARQLEKVNKAIERQVVILEQNKRQLFSALNQQNAAYQSQRDVILSGQQVVTADLKAQLSDRSSIVKQFLDNVVNASARAREEIQTAIDLTRSLEKSVSDARFQAKLQRTEDPAQQAQLLKQRSDELVNAARRAQGAGEQDKADQFLREAVQLSNQLLNIEGQTTAAIDQQEKVLAAANQLQAERVQLQRELAAAADQERSSIRQTVTQLSQAEARLLELQKQRSEAPGFDTTKFDADIKIAEEEYTRLLNKIKANPLAEKLLPKEDLDKLTSNFFSVLTGKEVTLPVLLDANIDDLFARLRAAAEKSDPIGLRVKIEEITGKAFNPSGGAAQQGDFLNQVKTAETALRGQADLKEAKDAFNNSLQSITDTIREDISTLTPLQKEAAGFASLFSGVNVEAEELAKRATDLQGVFNALKQGNVDALIQQINKLPPQYDDIRETVARQVPLLQQQQEKVNDVTEALNSNVEALLNVKDAVIQLNRAAESSSGGGGGNGRANGSLILRASGGGVGTDTVPAMLSPDEFVVNSQAAKRFFPQLVAMNAGMSPMNYRASGGQVTNNISLGDVVVNNSSGPVNGREIATQIRRELRKGTSQL